MRHFSQANLSTPPTHDRLLPEELLGLDQGFAALVYD
jgi:hypothetical protein